MVFGVACANVDNLYAIDYYLVGGNGKNLAFVFPIDYRKVLAQYGQGFVDMDVELFVDAFLNQQCIVIGRDFYPFFNGFHLTCGAHGNGLCTK